MALILSFETSGNICSVALHENKTLLKDVQVNENQAHAAKLAILIQQVFEGTGKALKDTNAVAVSGGPGSYTGLRIGTSVAKGICYALEIPLIACSTLEILSHQFLHSQHNSNGILCPMIDARRMEVYCQLFDSKLTPTSDIEAKIIDEFSFSELLDTSKVFFFGDGAEKCKTIIKNAKANFIDGILSTAQALGVLACIKFEKRNFEDLSLYKPFYLKDFVAKKAQPLI